MPLRLSDEGERVFREWHDRCESKEDAALVAGVLRAVAHWDWQRRWHHSAHPADPDITVIEPRPGMAVLIRLWEPDEPEQFTLIAIAG